MSLLYTFIALDLAHERAREAEADAQRWRLARLAREDGDAPRGGGTGPARRLAAASLRKVSGVADSIASTTCSAATRLERRTA